MEIGKKPSWLKRRVENAQLKGFKTEFFEERTRILSNLLKQVISGKFSDQSLIYPEMSTMDERIVEYPIILQEITKFCKADTVIDIGCVLNNPQLEPYLYKYISHMWFMNASYEKIHFKHDSSYIAADIRSHHLPDELKFDFVSCLSTLEHVGMDNTRYGGLPAEFDGDFITPEDLAINAASNLLKLVKPGGKFLISLPYGIFEYLYEYGKPEQKAYYSFNENQLRKFIEHIVGFKVETTIYKVVPNVGWVQCRANDQDILPYAVDCASAGAVVFIKGEKHE